MLPLAEKGPPDHRSMHVIHDSVGLGLLGLIF